MIVPFQGGRGDFSHTCGIFQFKLPFRSFVKTRQTSGTLIVTRWCCAINVRVKKRVYVQQFGYPRKEGNQDPRSWHNVKRKADYHRPKQAWPEMGYLMCLNMSATFPFTWKVKQSRWCVRDRLQWGQISSPGAPWSLRSWREALWLKLEKVPTADSLVLPYTLAVFEDRVHCLNLEEGQCLQETNTGTATATLLLLWLIKGKSNNINASKSHRTKRCEDKIIYIARKLMLGFYFINIPT